MYRFPILSVDSRHFIKLRPLNLKWQSNKLQMIDTNPMKFEVQATCITHRFSVIASAPQGGVCGLTVGATEAIPPRCLLLQACSS